MRFIVTQDSNGICTGHRRYTMKKPWAGRFKEQTSKVVESFTESISFDHRLWKYDIEGSIAHAKMLSQQRIIPKSDAVKIINGLREIAGEIETGKFIFREDLEDIHMNIEAALIKGQGMQGENCIPHAHGTIRWRST